MSDPLDSIADSVADLKAEVAQLRRINAEILELLEKMAPNVADIEHLTRFPPETS